MLLLGIMFLLNPKHGLGIIPVSYTHLDVYKRQGVDLTYGKVRLLGLSIGNPADLEQPQCGQLEFDFPEE